MSDVPVVPPEEIRPALVTGSVKARVLELALPALGEQLLNFCVGLFDVFLAGQVRHDGMETGLTTSAVAISAYQSWLATLIFALVGSGTTVLVSRSWGAGDYEQANRFANRSITLAGVLGAIMFGLLYFLAPTIATLQDMHGKSREIAVHFLQTDAYGELMFGFCVIGMAALRGTGNMRTPMVVLGVVNILNIIVSTSLVYGVGPIEPWGLNGIVAGTVTARICGGLLTLLVLSRGLNGLKLQRQLLWPHVDDVRRILRIGGPHAMDGVLTWIGQFLYVMVIVRLGSESVGKAYLAAHMIGMEVEALTYLPATAWAQATAALIGQSLGAKDIPRAKQIGHAAGRQITGVAVCSAIVYLIGAPFIYDVMTQEQTVREIGVPALRFLSWYQVPLALLIVYGSAIRGAGETRAMLLVSMLGIFCVRLPVGYLCGIIWHGGLIGAWTGMCIDVTIRACLAILLYRRGRWTATIV